MIGKEVPVADAAGLMGVSERHAWRLLAAYREEGAAAIAHGNRGRRPSTATAAEVQERVLALAQGRYAGFNHSHLTEVLAGREGIHLSRSTVRRVLLAGGVRSPRRRRARRRYLRRARYPQEGMLLQINGSRHDWLEGRGPRLTLIGAVDDATGMVPFALFREQEDAQGYMLMLKEVRRSSSAAECRWPSTATGIASSNAHPSRLRAGTNSFEAGASPHSSPEHLRSWASNSSWPIRRRRRVGWNVRGTPSRTVWSPRCASRARRPLRRPTGCCGTSCRATISSSAWPPAQQASAYRQLPPDVSLEAVLCFKYLRTVAHDNTIRFNGAALQLLPDGLRASYARARVEVQERLDGSIVVVHRGRTVATKSAPAEPVVLRARSGRRPNGQPPVDSHPLLDDIGHGAQTAAPRPPAKTQARIPTKPALTHPWRRALLT